MPRILCLVFGFSCLQMPAEASVLYTVTNLGAANPIAINNQGEVLASDFEGLPSLYVNGQRQYLPQPAQGTFSARALNDLGQVAGYVNLPGQYNYFLSIDSGGTLNVMTRFSGFDPAAINNAGQIAGIAVFTYQSFLYSNGAITQISNPAGNSEAVANGIDAAGDVVGFTLSNNVYQAFLFSNGAFLPISAPGGAAESQAGAISRAGQIAGEYNPLNDRLDSKLFLYSQGQAQDLGSPQSNALLFPTSINDAGAIVGQTQGAGVEYAWLYAPANGFTNLNDVIAQNSGWSLATAAGINDAGQILGAGLLNGQQNAFLLTPIPEPGSFALIGVGLFAGITARGLIRNRGAKRMAERG